MIVQGKASSTLNFSSQQIRFFLIIKKKNGSFLKSMNKINLNSIFGLTELATEVLIISAYDLKKETRI